MSIHGLATPTAARTDHDWQDSAACRTSGDDPDLWHLPGESAIRAAKAVCRSCPVKDDCLAKALADPRLAGVWGATDATERRAMRLRRQREHVPDSWEHGTEHGHALHLWAGQESCEACRTAASKASAKRNARRRNHRAEQASA